MNQILTVAKKEFRAYFSSPIALIFLGTFLFVTLFTFFWVETFFTRNLADIRPLFQWLPVLLIFLGAALTMRLWSEEQKLGTFELLATLPVETHKLVLGKFLASLALVSVALALTFGVPVSVSFMGDLDWGAVFGGYFGALLLAGAYIAIGLCISAVTNNQIIALIFTCLFCGILYLLGTDPVTNLAGNRGAEILRALSTGSRFESIRRGVIDLRDLTYYASITVSFLVLNTVILEAKSWSQGKRTAPRRRARTLLVGLAAANMFLINIVLGPVHSARVDLTEHGEYSISQVTKDLVNSLPEPLLIRGYFSSKTHPLLAPTVPRIRDLIEEYGVVSGGKVQTEYVDPREDENIEKEANQLYGIKSFPFRISSRYDDSVVNSYFSILIKYGDQYQVLSFSDLIEVQATGMNDIEVKLRNLEYDLTRAIKKVAFGFQTLEAVFADLDDKAEFMAFVSTNTLPENFKDVPERITTVMKELEGRSGGKFSYRIVDPDAEGVTETRDVLFKKYGFKPFAASLFAKETFYMHLLLKVGDRYERVFPGESMSEADIKTEVTAAIKRAAPGFLKTIGLVKPEPEKPPTPPHQFGPPPPRPPADVTRMLNKQLSETYTIKDVDLKNGRVPGDVDVLLVYAPKNFDDKQRFAVDQYLMRGGTVIVLTGKYELDPTAQDGIKVRKVTSGLEDVLAKYGVSIQDTMVLDPQNEAFPIPVVRNLGGIRVRDIKRVKYPFFVDIRQTGMDTENPVLAGLPAVTLQWASPLTVTEPPKAKEGEEGPARSFEVLLKSTDGAWTQTDTNVQPNFERHEDGFVPGSDQKSRPLAVVVKGTFESFFKGKKAPGAEGTLEGQVINRSPGTTRLVVVGSSAFANDMVLGISRQSGGDRYANNLQLVQNLVDWGLEDTDLLTIRSRGTMARTLLPLTPKERSTWELVNYGAVILALGLIVAISSGRKRRRSPIKLDPSSSSKSRINSGPSLGQSAPEAS